jgi:hypothetical protein
MMLDLLRYQKLRELLTLLLIDAIFPFVIVTNVNLLSLLNPEEEGSMTFGNINNPLPFDMA